ncbi:MAG TPA: maleylacetate reductase [Jatrophihabitans sp.]|nr:maleylacetate reductase [Jatrophihabitans sp.]
MPLNFAHETKGQRVLFGAGRAATDLSAETARFAARAPFVVAGDRHDGLIAAAGLGAAARYRRVVQHVPVELAQDARDAARAAGADLLIAVGGGSATGLAKAVALTCGAPIVAVPTTFAGSEATDVWGLTEAGRKRTGTDARVLPASVIYDAELVAALPPDLAVASGLNAVAHSVDAMWGPQVDPIDAALAMEGLRTLRAGLPGVLGGDPDATEQALYGSYLAAVAFASAGAGLHHKICHVLGGAFGLPHAPTHAVVLPYVLAYNAPYAPQAAGRIAAALGDPDPTAGLDRLRADLDAPRALRELGLAADDVDTAAMLVLPDVPASNPRPVDDDSLAALLHAAWAGSDPRLIGMEDSG